MVKTTLGRRWLSLFLTLVLSLTLAPAALADDPEDTDPPAVTGITAKLNKDKLVLTEEGAGETLKLTVTDSNGDELSSSDYTVKWEAKGDAITVSQTGKVTPLVPGDAVVTAEVTYSPPGGEKFTAKAECEVEVLVLVKLRLQPSGPLILETEGRLRQETITATTTPDDAKVTWSSSDSAVAQVGSTDANGHTATLTGRSPGKATITATATQGKSEAKATIDVEVSGIVLSKTDLSVREGDEVDIPTISRFGAARNGTLSFQSADNSVAAVVGTTVEGRGPGTTTITVYAGVDYQEIFTVTVSSNREVTIEVPRFLTTDTLSFADYLDNFNDQAGGRLSHLTGLYVDPAQGILYYRYNADNGPEGVAQSQDYYYNATGRQKSLGEITFVPNPGYTGSQVTINYTVVSTLHQNSNGRIILNMVKGQASEIQLTGTHSYPARFSSEDFNRICVQNYGAALNYVTFSLPPSSQGVLYTDYVSDDDFGTKITAGTQYRRRDLDSVSFVPAASFSGTATIYYTGRAAGSPGASYTGQVTVTVTRDSPSKGENLIYSCYSGGTVTLDDERFDDYWQNDLNGRGSLNFIRFDSLPAASQGTLYCRYRSASNPGTPAQTGTNYYCGTYTPRLDQITFVPDQYFSGTVYIPFTGWSNNGDRFSGTIEIDVTGSGGAGSIWYDCKPGRTVKFDAGDFNQLSRDLTGRAVDYIQFQNLPNSSSQGWLLHSGSRITSSALSRQYSNGSGSYRIQYLSFQAAGGFSGTVDIPFTGMSANGVSFTGTLTIASDGSGGRDMTIYYTTDYGDAAVFDRDDFDNLSWDETGEDVSSVQFEIPSTSRGSLYQGYRSSTSRGSRITSDSTRISASDLDRVAFLPASGFTGTVNIDFTATARNGGGTFTGTVQVDVGQAGTSATARYSTWTSPVSFRSVDLRGGGTLDYIRLTSLPSANEGKLYSIYESSTKGGRAGMGVSYYASQSRGEPIDWLTFVPRAGFTGTVRLPYTGTNTNGSSFQGEVVIDVSPAYGSNHFSDMGMYGAEAQAAVAYLYDSGVVHGISATQFAPQGNITRGDFAVMLYNAFNAFNSTSSGGSQAFTDVPADTYYTEAVNTLHRMGIVNGVGGGKYAPTGNVSRQDAICMVHRAMRSMGWSTGSGGGSLLSSYSDGGSVADYARNDMANAVLKGYLPITNGRLDSNALLTRVDMALILHRVLTY